MHKVFRYFIYHLIYLSYFLAIISFMEYILKRLQPICHSMFKKNLLGIFHGSVSAKIDDYKFVINTKNAMFNNLQEKDLIELRIKDNAYNLASSHTSLHRNIYENISSAKYICIMCSDYAMSYSLKANEIKPLDYFGHKHLKKVPVVDIGSFDSWDERMTSFIYAKFKELDTNIISFKDMVFVCIQEIFYT